MISTLESAQFHRAHLHMISISRSNPHPLSTSPLPPSSPPSNDDDNCSSNVVIIFPILCFISGMEDGAPLEIKVNVIKFYVRLMEDDVRSKMAALHFFSLSLSFSLFDLLFRRPAYLRKYPAHLHVICIIGSENTLLLPSPRKKKRNGRFGVATNPIGR